MPKLMLELEVHDLAQSFSLRSYRMHELRSNCVCWLILQSESKQLLRLDRLVHGQDLNFIRLMFHNHFTLYDLFYWRSVQQIYIKYILGLLLVLSSGITETKYRFD